MRHMYWGCYCKSGSCGQFHLVHYIGLTLESTFVQPEGRWDFTCPRCGTSHRYNGTDLAVIAGHAFPPAWQPWFGPTYAEVFLTPWVNDVTSFSARSYLITPPSRFAPLGRSLGNDRNLLRADFL
jgi:hypothetical protein